MSITGSDVSELQAAAVEAARLGGAELRARWGTARRIEHKSAIDLVTDADKASEERILGYLSRRFPDHAVLAEEQGAREGRAPWRWLVDPLDGTTNYAHRMPHFCTSVAVEDAQGLVAGAVYDPMREELFEAGRGGGTLLNGQPVHVSTEKRLSHCLFATGFPYWVREHPDVPIALLKAFLVEGQGIRRAGSAALDLAWVACGRCDGFFEAHLQPWDWAAGALLVREAGGTATGLWGGAIGTSGAVLASNGHVHEEMLARTIRVRAEHRDDPAVR